jgi:carotenoid cleavage dioxygenase
MFSVGTENSDNPYLQGSFLPVQEEVTDSEFEVIGEIPSDFKGTYARNGPNPHHTPKGRHHWFDGDGMIHAFHFNEGKATYRNRFVRTQGFASENKSGHALWTGIMESPRENPKGALYKDTANTDILLHNGELLALWYLSGLPYRLDPINLENHGPTDFGSGKGIRLSAHAKADERTGELLFFDYGPRPPFMSYGVVDKSGQLVHSCDVPLPGPRLPHDMACTENYSILMDLPVFQDAEVKDRWRAKFYPELNTRFGIIPRHGSDVRWFEASPCYIYHTINAWEEGDEIVMVACRVADPIPTPDKRFGKWAVLMGNLTISAELWRWRFNLETGETTEERLDDRNAEFPMINNRMLGQKTRYAYSQLLVNDPQLRFTGIAKYDTDSGASEIYEYGDGRFGSEAPFAPRIDATAEDDGYLLSFVHDERENRSELLIVDAKNVTDGPVARVLLPHRVPMGFHACWAPADLF